MIDVLSYFVPDQVWALENHLETASGLPVFTIVLDNQIWVIKSTAGNPWDMFTFDGTNIYGSVVTADTPDGWTNPEVFKIFASKSWPGNNGGVVWCPRHIQPNEMIPLISTNDSSYRLYSSCGQYISSDLGGPLMTTMQGPTMNDFGGDLGRRSVLEQNYYWGPELANLEVNFYDPVYGLVQWELWGMVNGLFSRKQVSAFNKFAPGGIGGTKPAVKLNFPCGVPVIS